MSLEIKKKAFIVQNDLATNEGATPPKWLDTKFLEKYLQEYYNDKEITILKFELNSGTGNRENYCSSLYRLNATFTNDLEKSSFDKSQVSCWTCNFCD